MRIAQDSMQTIDLSLDDFFAAGGNRCCFTVPEKTNLCVKVNRVDRSPAFKKAKAPIYKRLRSLDAFDENQEEYRVLGALETFAPEAAGRLIPKCHGWVNTPFGSGLLLTLFRNADGNVSDTVEMEMVRNGVTAELKRAVALFKEEWREVAVPSRQLLLHNIVINKDKNHWRLAVIDGLGSGEALPLGKLLPSMRRRQIERRLDQFDKRLEDFNNLCAKGLAVDKGWVRQRTEPLDNAFKLKALGLDPDVAVGKW